MRLKEIADFLGGRIIGNPATEITGVSSITDAKTGTITFAADKKHLLYAHQTDASAIILKEEAKDISADMVIVDNPYLAFARTLELFYKKEFKPIGVSNEAIAGKNFRYGNDVSVYPMVYIGRDVSIGDRVVIYPHVYIGDDVLVGEDTVIYPNTTIRENVRIGRNVIIHSGAVIGSDGFGYVREKETHYKIPQVGGVIIEDDVEIGANTTIDRATMGNTLIMRGTKIDNLVQIAHNVKIGRNCIIVSQVGIAGSAEIGDSVILGGQAGVANHKKIADGVMVAGRAGVADDLKKGAYSGMPAIPHTDWLRAQSIYAKLPELLKRIREIEKKILPFKKSS